MLVIRHATGASEELPHRRERKETGRLFVVLLLVFVVLVTSFPVTPVFASVSYPITTGMSLCSGSLPPTNILYDGNVQSYVEVSDTCPGSHVTAVFDPYWLPSGVHGVFRVDAWLPSGAGSNVLSITYNYQDGRSFTKSITLSDGSSVAIWESDVFPAGQSVSVDILSGRGTVRIGEIGVYPSTESPSDVPSGSSPYCSYPWPTYGGGDFLWDGDVGTGASVEATSSSYGASFSGGVRDSSGYPTLSNRWRVYFVDSGIGASVTYVDQPNDPNQVTVTVPDHYTGWFGIDEWAELVIVRPGLNQGLMTVSEIGVDGLRLCSESERVPHDPLPPDDGGGGIPGVLVLSPKYVTWDGLFVYVAQGYASEIYYSFPEDSLFVEKLACTDKDTGTWDCLIGDVLHPGEVIRVRGVGSDGSEYVFEVTLAVHVELGRYSFQLLEQILEAIKALPSQIVGGVGGAIIIDPDGDGFQKLIDAMDRLRNSGGFGQVNVTVTIINDGVGQLISDPPDFENGPRNYRSGPSGVEGLTIPCEDDEWEKLSFCIPLAAGFPDSSGKQYTQYVRLDIPNTVRSSWSAYHWVFTLVNAGIWIGFAYWLVKQFVPKLTA